MTGPSDAPTPDRPRSSAGSPARPPRSVLRSIALPAVIGSAAGIGVVVIPWSRYVLVLLITITGLAWLLRIAGDWLVERAGPQRGVLLIGSVLFGTWLIMAINPPGPLRGAGFGPIHTPREEKDPYALPPAGTRSTIPNFKEPGQPIDPVQPLRDLVTPQPTYQPPPPPTPPADGRQGRPSVGLRVSSSQSAYGEGVVLIADVKGDGRTVRGLVAFLADGKEVDRRSLRVQGIGSQIEFRLVGLAVGTHTLQARYLGSRLFEAAESPAVAHRVVRR